MTLTWPLPFDKAPYLAALVAISCTIIEMMTARRGGSGSRRRRVEQIYDDTLVGIETKHLRGVEWRIKQSTKVFGEPDPHRGNLVHRHAGRVAICEFLQIVRGAAIGRDQISADLLNAHLND